LTRSSPHVQFLFVFCQEALTPRLVPPRQRGPSFDIAQLKQQTPQHKPFTQLRVTRRKVQGIPTFNKQYWKHYAVHAVFLSLILTVAIQGRAAAGVDQSSLLYTLISGEEISEGPLDPSAYAQTDAPGVGGARLAAIDGGSGLDIITFSNPEVSFSATLGGNVAQAPLSPVLPEPGEEAAGETAAATGRRDAFLYTVQENDTIAAIAEHYDITSETILWANGISSRDVIKVGDHLTILPTSGVLHTVSSGDTLLAIANKYDVEAADIAEYNSLEDTHSLSIGDKLIVPGGAITAPQVAPNIVSRDTKLADDSDGPTPEPVKSAGAGMVWPTTTKHISQYFRWGHTGIDIDNRSQPAIYAALDGTVEFAGWLGAYGNLIIINHGNGLQTYYAHNSKHYVGKGTAVSKGQAIAQMGSTGRSSGPHVHFEVRRNGAPINPMGMF
jgi:LysM repeat protein